MLYDSFTLSRPRLINATDCADALQSNVDADGDYISKRTLNAFERR